MPLANTVNNWPLYYLCIYFVSLHYVKVDQWLRLVIDACIFKRINCCLGMLIIQKGPNFNTLSNGITSSFLFICFFGERWSAIFFYFWRVIYYYDNFFRKIFADFHSLFGLFDIYSIVKLIFISTNCEEIGKWIPIEYVFFNFAKQMIRSKHISSPLCWHLTST